MKDGRAYVSFGPVMYPQNVMFGDTMKMAVNQPQSITIDLAAANGLKTVQLVGNTRTDDTDTSSESSRVIAERTLTGDHASVTFALPEASGWVSLVVEDNEGRKAYSNPVWLELVQEEQF
jgi:hypothetical protein